MLTFVSWAPFWPAGCCRQGLMVDSPAPAVRTCSILTKLCNNQLQDTAWVQLVAAWLTSFWHGYLPVSGFLIMRCSLVWTTNLLCSLAGLGRVQQSCGLLFKNMQPRQHRLWACKGIYQQLVMRCLVSPQSACAEGLRIAITLARLAFANCGLHGYCWGFAPSRRCSARSREIGVQSVVGRGSAWLFEVGIRQSSCVRMQGPFRECWGRGQH